MNDTCLWCKGPLGNSPSPDYCRFECQRDAMAKGFERLPADRPGEDIEAILRADVAAGRFAAAVAQVPTPTPVALEVPADAPRRVARWRGLGRLRMGRRR